MVKYFSVMLKSLDCSGHVLIKKAVCVLLINDLLYSNESGFSDSLHRHGRQLLLLLSCSFPNVSESVFEQQREHLGKCSHANRLQDNVLFICTQEAPVCPSYLSHCKLFMKFLQEQTFRVNNETGSLGRVNGLISDCRWVSGG
ncbi:hypothetical protein ILYODFUR_016588 [Ilyodon furcidens]|uniref:Uncharacterized protein n=1 Tax=Ilyodon furcidens TaxID=33524 RepID=A0ABV0UGL1_9TELE